MLRILGMDSLESLKTVFDKLFAVDIDITEEEIKEYSNTFASNKAKLKNHPEQVDVEIIEDFYLRSLGLKK